MSASPDRSRPLRATRAAVGDPSRNEAVQASARIGLVARGIVYGVIGILAFKLAIGAGGRAESQTGALKTIGHQPFGEVLLIALAIGLGAYAVWRLVDGIAGTPPRGDRALQHRVSAIASGAGYAALCCVAITIIAGAQSSGGSSGSARHATAGVLGWPGGPVIVAVTGLVVIAVGAYQGYKGLARRFEDEARVEQMGSGTRAAFTALGVTGHVARAIVFILIGYGLIRAALAFSSRSAVGLDGALQKLAHAPAGPVLLGIVALGFIAFALFSIVDARYHRV
ncbi:MAG TPA: DUF1206 domain-containing protein [Solirubrobacteraceae bacterium]|nr:DUF1206 domain-containing protein [Solirubrobacteraceae bacterium]